MWKVFITLWKLLDDPASWRWSNTSQGWEYQHRNSGLAFRSYEVVIWNGFDPIGDGVFVYPWWMRQALAWKARRMRRHNVRKEKRKVEYQRIMSAILGVKNADGK